MNLLVEILECVALLMAGVVLGKPYGFWIAALAVLALLAAVGVTTGLVHLR